MRRFQLEAVLSRAWLRRRYTVSESSTMSITVEYLFNSPDDMITLLSHFRTTLGVNFSSYEGDPADQFCRFLGMELTLQIDHGLSNDRECNFEDYAYKLDSRTPIPDGDLRPIQIETMAVLAFVLHKRLSINNGLLTFDVQVPLARYEARDGNWFDTISNATVDFPQHFQDLRSRVDHSYLPDADNE